jgi:hypothetical protein
MIIAGVSSVAWLVEVKGRPARYGQSNPSSSIGFVAAMALRRLAPMLSGPAVARQWL